MTPSSSTRRGATRGCRRRAWRRCAWTVSRTPRGAFVFLWCGDGNDHLLERGRECLRAWGFRRVEEIVWLKTNKEKRYEPEA